MRLLWVIIWLIWCLLDNYSIIIRLLFDDYLRLFEVFDQDLLFDQYSLYKICKVNDSPNFAFAGYAASNTGGKPAGPAKVISDLLDSSLQSIPRAFGCA